MRAAAAAGRRTVPRAGDLVRQAAGALWRLPRPPSPALRRRLLVLVLVGAALGAVYMLWFRDSSLVRVERVRVTGVSGTDAARERAALVAAAKRMTTLHVDAAALRRALGAGATVEAVHATADFPHGLRIEVVEMAPVAVLDYGSQRVAVGESGVLLPDVRPIPRALPAIDVGALPSHGRLGSGRAQRLVAAAATAPPALRGRVMRLGELPGKGLVAYLHDGPLVILGTTAHLRAKWTAAAAILADGTSRGAAYVDVRLPGRPVAGGLDIAAPPDEQSGALPIQPGVPRSGATPGGSATAPAAPGQAAAPTTPQAPATASPAPAPAQGTTAPAPGAGP